MTKPLVFAETAAPVKVASGPKPLAFPEPAAKQPPAQHSTGRLDFPTTAPKVEHPKPADPKLLFGEARSPISGDTLKYIQTNFADLFREHRQKFELQVSQLLPIKLETVMEWGSKTMERMRETSNTAAALTADFSAADGTKLLDEAVKAVQNYSPGLLSRFKQKPTDYEPRLSVLQSSLSGWMAKCGSLLKAARENHQAVLVKMLSLSAVYEVAGEPPDQMLAQTLHNRRVMMQQGATQSELVMKQLEAMYQQMVDQHQRVDQVLNVTLPAWKNAVARL